MASEHTDGWAWFEPGPEPTSSGGIDVEALPALFVRCFRGQDGEAVLRYLRTITLGRALSPTHGDAELRHVEGQRQLVNHILALVNRGMEGG